MAEINPPQEGTNLTTKTLTIEGFIEIRIKGKITSQISRLCDLARRLSREHYDKAEIEEYINYLQKEYREELLCLLEKERPLSNNTLKKPQTDVFERSERKEQILRKAIISKLYTTEVLIGCMKRQISQKIEEIGAIIDKISKWSPKSKNKQKQYLFEYKLEIFRYLEYRSPAIKVIKGRQKEVFAELEKQKQNFLQRIGDDEVSSSDLIAETNNGLSNSTLMLKIYQSNSKVEQLSPDKLREETNRVVASISDLNIKSKFEAFLNSLDECYERLYNPEDPALAVSHTLIFRYVIRENLIDAIKVLRTGSTENAINFLKEYYKRAPSYTADYINMRENCINDYQ